MKGVKIGDQVEQGIYEVTFENYIFPLRVFKQIIFMFMAHTAEIQREHPEFTRFILNERNRDWDPRIRIYMYLNLSQHIRLSGKIRRMNQPPDIQEFMQLLHAAPTRIFSNQGIDVISEISAYPFGYYMTFGHEEEHIGADITYFSQSLYEEKKYISATLPNRCVLSSIPGYFYDEKEQQ